MSSAEGDIDICVGLSNSALILIFGKGNDISQTYLIFAFSNVIIFELPVTILYSYVGRGYDSN